MRERGVGKDLTISCCLDTYRLALSLSLSEASCFVAHALFPLHDGGSCFHSLQSLVYMGGETWKLNKSQ